LQISDILSNHITPFETEDMKLKSLFSFFLHLAPTISSSSAGDVPKAGLAQAWDSFIREAKIKDESFRFYSSGSIGDKQLARYSLSNSSPVSRQSKRFVCSKKHANECEMRCLLRHLRNSIAHSNVYLLNNNRKYILFDDFNVKQNCSARILFSQSDLSVLKKYLR
jgi:hypothetical protein